MESLAEMGWFAALAGLVVGAALGGWARARHFCALGSLERWWYAGELGGLRAWGAAAGVAVVATQAMAFAGWIDLSRSFYMDPAFGLTGAILGGLMFGLGMAMVGACGFSALVQLGGGSLRALVALVALGLAALAAQRGLLGQLRIPLVDDRAIDMGFAGDQSLGAVVSAWLGVDARMAVAVLVSALLLGWAARSGDRARGPLLTGAVVGLLISAGWLATTYAAAHGFAPVQMEAGSFVVPLGDAILQVATYTGTLPDYGVGMVVGVPLGSAVIARMRRDVRWEACDDARELGRHLIGAALMGVGGVFAMGCTIGQGLSATSTLAISAPVAVASMVVGARLGLAWMLEGSIRHVLTRSRGAPAE